MSHNSVYFVTLFRFYIDHSGRRRREKANTKGFDMVSNRSLLIVTLTQSKHKNSPETMKR